MFRMSLHCWMKQKPSVKSRKIYVHAEDVIGSVLAVLCPPQSFPVDFEA